MTTVYSGFLDMAFGAAFLLGCVFGLLAGWFDSKTTYGGQSAPPPPDAGKFNRG